MSNVIRALVDRQAEDEGLWFVAQTAAEAYLQQELRRLHAAIESEEATASEAILLDGAEGGAAEHVVRSAVVRVTLSPFVPQAHDHAVWVELVTGSRVCAYYGKDGAAATREHARIVEWLGWPTAPVVAR